MENERVRDIFQVVFIFYLILVTYFLHYFCHGFI